jgi:hypothetical protein
MSKAAQKIKRFFLTRLFPENSWRIIPDSQNFIKIQALFCGNLIFTPKDALDFFMPCFPAACGRVRTLPQTEIIRGSTLESIVKYRV